MLRAFRWLTQDGYSRAGHFYFPTVSEPKLAPGTKAEDSCFLWTAGRSHDFPRRGGRAHEGSLGPVLRQEVTRMKKKPPLLKEGWGEAEGLPCSIQGTQE